MFHHIILYFRGNIKDPDVVWSVLCREGEAGGLWEGKRSTACNFILKQFWINSKYCLVCELLMFSQDCSTNRLDNPYSSLQCVDCRGILVTLVMVVKMLKFVLEYYCIIIGHWVPMSIMYPIYNKLYFEILATNLVFLLSQCPGSTQ